MHPTRVPPRNRVPQEPTRTEGNEWLTVPVYCRTSTCTLGLSEYMKMHGAAR
eukprot:COSAG02_NODE_12509_length_1535_cov_0.991643_2_plen_52_part_00